MADSHTQLPRPAAARRGPASGCGRRPLRTSTPASGPAAAASGDGGASVPSVRIVITGSTAAAVEGPPELVRPLLQCLECPTLGFDPSGADGPDGPRACGRR